MKDALLAAKVYSEPDGPALLDEAIKRSGINATEGKGIHLLLGSMSSGLEQAERPSTAAIKRSLASLKIPSQRKDVEDPRQQEGLSRDSDGPEIER